MPNTSPVRPGEEIDADRLKTYLEPRLGPWPDDPLTITEFIQGRSNLTYLLEVGDWCGVLRRPPLGPVAPRAHDMIREFQWLKAIHPVFPWAPRPIWLCTDEAIIGSVFLIMEYKPGIVFAEDFTHPFTYAPELGSHVSQLMVKRLVDLHNVTWQHIPIQGWVKPEGFLARQVTGWITRYHKAKVRTIPGDEELTGWLASHVPVSPPPTVIHYDYKLNNVVFYPDWSDLAGIFDWEMSTVGDPTADLAVAMSYWLEAGDPPLLHDALGASVTTRPGFWSRDEFVEAYSRESGRAVEHWPFYQTFAYFKLAVIIAQIYYRYAHGQTHDERFKSFDARTENLIHYALTIRPLG